MAIRAKIASALLFGGVLIVCMGCGHKAKPSREPSQSSQGQVQQQSQVLYPYATNSSGGSSGLGGSLGRGGGIQSASDFEIVDGVRVYRVGGRIKAPYAIYAAGLDC